MKQFTGFPTRMQFTPIPNLFFSTLLPQISDMAELKITLHIFSALYRKKGYPRCVSYRELAGIPSLMRSLTGAAGPPAEVLRRALAMAAKRGTILHIALDRDGGAEDIYFLNTESDRKTMARIQNGDLSLASPGTGGNSDAAIMEQPDIFTLYEENIGMLTPLISEELSQAERLYPAGWITDAIKEAVSLNKRNWRYISRILERWWQEGRSDGTPGRDSKKTDPDRYVKQKYGHMFRR